MSLMTFVDGLAARTAPRSTRRSFLERSALAGAALSVAPLDFALRPGTAYAAICGCSGSSCDCASACCDGYTEFCCTMTGSNSCPSGTLLGGWWKVDGSSFCGGAARYYLDCNATCGSCGCGSAGICPGWCSGTTCRCANGSCGNRKAGCTGFRYGQCHQEVPCLGPIVCRVVTCTVPWRLDSTCGTAARTDEATRNHNRPCLQNLPIGNIDEVRFTPNGVRVRGWALDKDTAAPIEVHVYVGSAGFASVRADAPRDDIAAAYPGYGAEHGFDIVVPYGGNGPVDVCLYGIDAGGGPNPRLACRTIVAGQPFGNIDELTWVPNGFRVRGWAVDPNTAEPIDVHLYLGGSSTAIAGVRADLRRDDVAAAYPGFGADHGFEVVVPYGGSGPVELCAFGIDPTGGPNPKIACRSIVAGQPFGSVDEVTRMPQGLRVRGWAIDPNTAGPIDVHLYLGSGTNAAAGVRADRRRDDVAAAYPAFGAHHGFEVVIPYGDPNPVQVCAFGIDTGGGPNPRLGCRTG
jgi:hypothetical protein